MKGHNFDHGKGDICLKCGEIHIHHMLNIPVTKEHIIKQKATMKKKYANGYISPRIGKKKTKEHIEKYKLARKKKKENGWVNPKIGIKLSPEKNKKAKQKRDRTWKKKRESGYISPKKNRPRAKESIIKQKATWKMRKENGYIHPNPNTGKTYEQIYGVERAKEIRENQSKAKLGKPNPKNSKIMKRQYKEGSRISPMKGKKHKSETIEKMKRNHASKKEGYINPRKNKIKSEKELKQWIKSCQMKPNKSELSLDSIIQPNFPNQFKLNVLGDIIIGGKIMDYVNINGQKKGIELFGDYWHYYKMKKINPFWTREQAEIERINHFKKYGWDILIIWEHELKQPEMVIEKINQFSTGIFK